MDVEDVSAAQGLVNTRCMMYRSGAQCRGGVPEVFSFDPLRVGWIDRDLDTIGKPKIKRRRKETRNRERTHLRAEGRAALDLVAHEVARADVRDVHELGDARGVRAFAHAGSAQEHPVDALARR